jgi:hypothetical protein
MITPGVRYFFAPLVEDIVLLMPVVELGATVALFEKYHQFKIDRNKQDFVEDQFSAGFHVGAGFSMFLLDVMLRYNYLPSNQFISFDLRARIPIFVTI